MYQPLGGTLLTGTERTTTRFPKGEVQTACAVVGDDLLGMGGQFT